MRAGFIGLGAMGRSMALNLHKAGLLAAVYNRSRDKAATLAQDTGCKAASDIAELASLCDGVVLCVTADADVLAVVDALAESRKKGSLVPDSSTVSAATARDAAARRKPRGVDFLDCPVSGGT